MARLEASPDEEFNEGHMSMYVCTRWYRAPELLFSLRYSFKVDVWSAGCIIIELYIKRPFLPGNSSDKQIALLIENFGLPRYIAKKIESHRVLYFLANQGLEAGNDTFKGTFPAFLDDNTYRGVIPAEASHSIRCMLHIDADMRATAEDILKSPYMGKYHNPTEEPEPKRFREADFGINQANSTAANISALIWKELEYHRGKYVDMMPELCKFSV
jgi:serine/threonine protein kinase